MQLNNVVVDSNDTGTKLFKNGRLTRRTTFLPLNKITANPVTDAQLKAARSLIPNGHNAVHRAIDLVEFSHELSPAIQFVLGGVLVCSDLEVANKVAFSNVRRLCVTLDGDKVNPSGELSGGAPSRAASTMAVANQLLEYTGQLEQKETQYQRSETETRELRTLAQRYNELKHEHDEKTNQLTLVRERLKNTQNFRLNEAVSELKSNITNYQHQIKEAKDVEKLSKQKSSDIEYKIKNAAEIKKKELKEAEAEVKKCKKNEESAKSAWTDKEAEEAGLKLEITQLQKNLEEENQQLLSSEEAIQGFISEAENLAQAVSTAKDAANEAKSHVKAQKDAVAANNREINTLNSSCEKLTKSNQSNELEVQQLNHRITKATEDASDARKTVENMLVQYEWIAEERKFFGQANTAYDFKATDPKEAAKRIQKLEGTKDKLEKTVNMRAMNMLGKAEEQYQELMKKKTTVENDRAKIYKVIEELDVKKRAEIRTAWDKVCRKIRTPGESSPLFFMAKVNIFLCINCDNSR